MNIPLHHCVRPGLVHFMAFPACMKGEGPVAETLSTLLADTFFEVVEFSWIKDPAERDRVRRLLETSCIEAKYAAQPRLLSQKLDLNAADPQARTRAVAEIKAAIDDAVDLGLREVAFLSGSDVPATERPAALERLVDSIRELCAHAEPRGIKLVLEVFDRDIDKKCLIGPAPLARELAERIRADHPNFGLMVDLSHIPLLRESPAQALQPVREHLAHIHIGNAYFGPARADPAWGDLHPRFGYPGGANDVPQLVEFLRELFAVGYLRLDGRHRAAISFEIRPVGDEDPHVLIAGAKRKFVQAWAELAL